MVLQLTYITRSKDDLIALSHTLAGALKPEALDDPAPPILWSNHGSLNAGKSLIAEYVASYLANKKIRGYFESEAGVLGYHSEIHSYYDQHKRQYQFADIFCPLARNMFFANHRREQRQMMTEIRKGHSNGIIFVHNANTVALENGADIDISLLERRNLWKSLTDQYVRMMPCFGRHGLKHAGLTADYNRASQNGDRDWIRMVQITIHNPDIFKPEFIQQANLISAMDSVRRFGLEAA